MLPNPFVLNLNQGLIANQIVQPNKEELVYYLDGGKSVISYILSRIAPSKRVTGQYGNIQKPLMGLQTVQNVVASTIQLSPTQIQINFTDPNYADFTVGDNVMNNPASNIHGLVYNTSQGMIQIRAIGNGNTLSTASFPNGSSVSTQWNTQGYVANTRTPLYQVPFYVQNWTEKMRWSTVLYSDDNYLTWSKGSNGQFWVHQQERLMIQKAMREIETEALYGVASGSDTGLGGRSTNMGIISAIQDPQRGGIVAPYSSIPTLSWFTNVLTQVKSRYNEPLVRLLVLCGTQFLQTFQTWIAPYIQYSGMRNTFGGEMVKGIDTYFYAIAGIEVGFICVPALDDPNLIPNYTTIPGLTGTISSNSAIVFDAGMYNTPDGQGMRPAVERIYFNPNGASEYVYKYLPGVVPEGAMDFGLNTPIAVTGADQIGVEMQFDGGVDCIGYRMAYLYPTN
jgi:hypothetical protein